MRSVSIKSQRGDTLIEVMLVIALMAIVVLSIFGMMGRGTANMQLSLERSVVRAELDGQVNALRAMRDAYVESPTSDLGLMWDNLVPARIIPGSPTFNDTSCSADGKAFFIQIDSANDISPQDYDDTNIPSAYAEPGKGMWLELYEKGPAKPKAVDVLARACWDAIGQNGKQFETSLVRLYDGKF